METRRTIYLLVLITATLLMVVGGGAIFLLYEAGFAQARTNLEGIVRAQALLIEGMNAGTRGRRDAADTSSMLEERLADAIANAYAEENSFGKTGEIVLGRLHGDSITLALPLGGKNSPAPAPVRLNSGLAEPMRLALAGHIGTVVAPDYKGEIVVAAYRPIPSLNLGIVAKMDLAEIRRPFLIASGLAVSISLVAIGFAAVATFMLTAPVVRRGEYGAQELRSILETAVAGIITIDETGIVRSANPAAEELFGYSHDGLRGIDAVTLFGEAEAATILTAPLPKQHAGDGHPMGSAHETTGLRKDGSTVPIHISISAFEVANGRFFTGIIRDISVQKLTEARLREATEAAERANRAKTEFLANMSHELRTPLNSIIGFSEVIDDETFGPIGHVNYHDYIQDIRSSGVHLLNLINDILDIAKVEAGKIEFNETLVDSHDVIGTTVHMLQDRWSSKGLEVHVDVCDRLPKLKGDELRLKQIVVNLLSNAIKFTPESGRIEIGVGLNNDGSMVWSVSDTGIGIAVNDQDRVLEPFEQVRQNATQTAEGVGLGLHLTRSLTEMHDGTLSINSAVGSGTTITVTFPSSRVVET